jgi:hypothetical protein
MSLVINKYKILHPCVSYDPDEVIPVGVEIPKSFPEGTTFEICGIDMCGFIFRELESGLKIQVNMDVFNHGFYKVGQ